MGTDSPVKRGKMAVGFGDSPLRSQSTYAMAAVADAAMASLVA